jgi:hypothetical protein
MIKAVPFFSDASEAFILRVAAGKLGVLFDGVSTLIYLQTDGC